MASNIDTFDTAVATILAHLYETFPRLVVVDTYRLADSADSEIRDAFAGTLIFLQREGFLTYSTRAGSGGQFSGVALTAKGLELLRATPQSLRSKAPLGEQLREGLKSTGKEAAKGLVKMILEAATSPEAWRKLTQA